VTDYGGIARELIKRHLGEAGITETCEQLGLSATDTELVYELLSKWKPATRTGQT